MSGNDFSSHGILLGTLSLSWDFLFFALLLASLIAGIWLLVLSCRTNNNRSRAASMLGGFALLTAIPAGRRPRQRWQSAAQAVKREGGKERGNCGEAGPCTLTWRLCRWR